MKNFRLLALCALGLTLVWPSLASAQSTGAATRYDVQVQSLELCTGNGGGNGCTGAFVVGSGSKTFDIASSSVGAQVGSYASTSSIPVGTTYSHVRVTLSRTFTMTGTVNSVTGVGGTGNCRTGGTDASGYTSGTAGTGLNTAGTATAQQLNVPDANAFGGGQPSFASNFNVANGATTMTITYALAQPFTVGISEPTISVIFDTATSLGAANSGGNCLMFPQPPSVTISIQ